MSEKTRNSSIELLKIIAIVLIIISHAVPYGNFSNYDAYIDLNHASADGNVVILAILRNLGSVGNCIFIICSSWFLLNSNKVNKKKILKLIIDSFIISITILLLIFIFSDYNVSLTEIIKSFFPITFNVNWFLTCYLLFYMIHPWLNTIIEKMDQRKLLMTNCILLFLYSIMNTLKADLFYFNSLIGFIVIYFLMAYIKKYLNKISHNRKVNIILCILALIALIGAIVFINFIGLRIDVFNNKLQIMNNFTNPLIIIISFTLFNIFKQKEFYNKAINYFSSLSLLIYLIHGNQFVVGYLKGFYFDYVYYHFGYQNIMIYVIILSFIYLLGSIILSMLYKHTIQNHFNKLIEKLYLWIKRFYHKIEKMLLSFH